MTTQAAPLPQVSVEHIVIGDDGIARLAGRRTKVAQIAIDKIAFGWDADQIQIQYPHLKLAEIHAALAYYYDHQSEIDEQIKRGEEWADAMRLQMEPQNREIIERLRTRAKPQ
jgi:uncharacterized protein (DUF433 family)